jgi:hypothetical protein
MVHLTPLQPSAPPISHKTCREYTEPNLLLFQVAADATPSIRTVRPQRCSMSNQYARRRYSYTINKASRVVSFAIWSTAPTKYEDNNHGLNDSLARSYAARLATAVSYLLGGLPIDAPNIIQPTELLKKCIAVIGNSRHDTDNRAEHLNVEQGNENFTLTLDKGLRDRLSASLISMHRLCPRAISASLATNSISDRP